MDPMNNGAKKEPAGAMISVIIVVIIIALGAYYFLKRVPAPVGEQTMQEERDATTDALSAQESSDEVADIQKDLDATPNISTVGEGLGSI